MQSVKNRQGKGREAWGCFRRGGQGGPPEAVTLRRDREDGKEQVQREPVGQGLLRSGHREKPGQQEASE